MSRSAPSCMSGRPVDGRLVLLRADLMGSLTSTRSFSGLVCIICSIPGEMRPELVTLELAPGSVDMGLEIRGSAAWQQEGGEKTSCHILVLLMLDSTMSCHSKEVPGCRPCC